jgi:hypothetical protein
MFSRQGVSRFIYSFPVQLVVVLIKKNHILLLYWLILFGFVTGYLSRRFGIPYLFLDPEYMGKVGFRSFMLMGFATGCFTMVFNISSYIVNGFRFPFIATLARPFMKFTLNNFFMPLLFLVVYLWQLIDFQLYNEFRNLGSVLFDMLGFFIGFAVVVILTITYFFQTNKDITHISGLETSDADPDAPFADHIVEEKGGKKWLVRFRVRKRKSWRVDTYLSSLTKVKLVRRTEHYEQKVIDQVFRQNHLNAAIIELIVFAIFIIMGLFKENPLFQVPAGASILLIFSMFIMLSGAFRFWLKTWAVTAFYFLFFFLNFLSQIGFFHPANKAFGIRYDSKAPYNLEALQALSDDVQAQRDKDSTLAILENWRSKFREKPPLVLLNCSGGGLRASMWTYRVLQAGDSLTRGKLFQSSELITGASGGMIGAAYYRELYDRYMLLSAGRKTPYVFPADRFLENIGTDLLNPIAFSITVSDLFFSYRKFKEGNTVYKKDRAYVFEKQLNLNTHDAFTKRLADYREAEREGRIPLMIFSPTIINDGRRLLVSSQDISYLIQNKPDSLFRYQPTVDAIEFRKLFKQQLADSIRFSSVLRMSATFPYILPSVNMPSEPGVQIMDAGIRDYSGLKTSLRFLYTFRDWIAESTSGVIFVDIRDSHRTRPMEANPHHSFLENIVNPLGNIYRNLLTTQDYNTDENFQYARSWFKGNLDYISFELPTKEEDISLSWHLTSREKKSIYSAINTEQNRTAMERLIKLVTKY